MPGVIVPPPASLPIYDFSNFRQGSPEQKKETARQVVEAFKTYGFVYLVNHGIPADKVQTLFDWSRKFFYLPEEIRNDPKIQRPAQVAGDFNFVARGYSPVGSEKLSQNVFDDNGIRTLRSVPDAKDMFEMGPFREPAMSREPNRYPPEAALPGFQAFTQAFFWDAHALGMDILRAIALGLGLREEYFVECHEDADNLLRLIRYPAIAREQMRSGKTARTTPHTDFGSITILFQDDVGGLEVEDPAKPGTYIQATPVEGSVIVNIADFLMRWSNDTLKSNLHRVVEPPAERDLPGGMELTKERFSVPYFIQADRHKIIKCAEGLEGDGAKYPPVSSGEYLGKRVEGVMKKL